jgi:hypothetical protein
MYLPYSTVGEIIYTVVDEQAADRYRFYIHPIDEGQYFPTGRHISRY